LKIKDIFKRISLNEQVARRKESILKNIQNIIQQYGHGLKKAKSYRRYGKQNSDGINGTIQNLWLDGI